jgi:MATE family multidrug resistance protein
MPLVAVWAYTYDGIYLAATRTRIMLLTVVASFGVFLVLVHALMPVWGNAGLWASVAAFLGLRGLLLHLYFPRLLRAI